MEIQKISVEIGYGDTKCCFLKDGEYIIFKFPTAVMRIKNAHSSFGAEMTDSYLFNGKKYFVGERAKSDSVSTRGIGFIETYSALIAYHAIKLATAYGFDVNKPIEISTGLSIMNWDRSDNFIKTLETINVDDIVIKPTIRLMAQGQGVFFDYAGDRSGIVCVVDIGYHSFDFLVFENGEPRKDLCYAEPIGVNKIITDLQAYVKKIFSGYISEQMAKEIFLTGTVMNFGEQVDFSEDIKELKEEYTQFILNELRTKSLEVLRAAKTVIISGGGAYFLENVELPKNVVFSETPFEFSNARGYLKGAK